MPANATKVDWLPNGGKADISLANKTLYKTDANGNITGYATFNEKGLQINRVDLTGKAHGGVDTPHVHEFEYNQNPKTGEWYAREVDQLPRKPTPGEVP